MSLRNLTNAGRVVSSQAAALRGYINCMRDVKPDTGKVATPC
jgi:hypothetical protein